MSESSKLSFPLLRIVEVFFFFFYPSWKVSSCPPFSGRLLTDKLPACGRCYPAAELISCFDSLQHLPGISVLPRSAVGEQSSTLRELFQSPTCRIFFFLEACSCVSFLFDWTEEVKKILSWIMRHWTEVLFILWTKVSIGMLADVLRPERPTFSMS